MKRLIKLIMGFFLLISIVTCSLEQTVQNTKTLLSSPKPGGCLSSIIDTHRQQWAENGSSNYVIKSSEDDLSANDGTYLITVNDGKIAAIKVVEDKWRQYISVADFPSYEGLTIEGMFNMLSECAESDRFSACSCTYDPKYGYPTTVAMDGLCTDCSTRIKTTLISLLSSSTKEP